MVVVIVFPGDIIVWASVYKIKNGYGQAKHELCLLFAEYQDDANFNFHNWFLLSKGVISDNKGRIVGPINLTFSLYHSSFSPLLKVEKKKPSFKGNRELCPSLRGNQLEKE